MTSRIIEFDWGHMNRRRVLLILSSVLVIHCSWGGEVAIAKESGGLSFDFHALSAERFGAASGGRNLAAGIKAKPVYGFIYNSNWADPSAGIPEEEVRKHVKWTESDGELMVFKDRGLLDVCKGDLRVAGEALASWETRIPIDSPQGGVYRLGFDYKMNHEIGTSGRCIVWIRNRFASYVDLENCDTEWKPYVTLVQVPAGTTEIKVNVNHSGVGSLVYRNLTLVAERSPTRVTLTACAHAQVDKSFAVGADQVGCITYMWKRAFGESAFDWKRFTFRLVLPKGFDFIAATWAKKGDADVTRRADGSSVVMLPAKRNESPPQSYKDSNWGRFGVLVRAKADASEGEGSFEALYDGKTISNVERTRWFTIAPVTARKPKRYRNGFFPGSGYGVYDDDEASFAYAKMASDAGADWWIPELPPKPRIAEIYRRAGISVITPQTCGIRDGYIVNGGKSFSDEKGRPPEDRFVARNPGRDSDLLNAVCPFSIIEERPYFLTNTMARMAVSVRGCDGIWANWEPHTYVNQGCMCDRCRRAFAAFIGKDEKIVDKELWWNEVRSGGKWEKENRAFRSMVHGRMIKVIDRHVRLATGADSSFGLIPGVAWCEMSSWWPKNNSAPECKQIEYAGSLRWIDPWGPYPFWNLDTAFAASEGFNVAYWFAAKDVREQVNRDYPVGKRPKILAFPQGNQSCEWITEPEWLGLGLDSFFFNGWEASVVYFFPKGYDARYWRSFAEATERAARYEDYVFDGRRCDNEVSVRTPGFSRRRKGRVSLYLDVSDVSLVQHAAYEKDGKLIVAVLNFSDSEAAPVEIDARGFRVAKGLVPAARCRVFELEK